MSELWHRLHTPEGRPHRGMDRGSCASAREENRVRRQLDACAVASLAARQHQEDVLRVWRHRLQVDGVDWVVIARNHDSTPMRARFGILKDLALCARYWVKNKFTKKVGYVDAEGYRKLTQETLPANGFVELMGQTGALHFCVVLHPPR